MGAMNIKKISVGKGTTQVPETEMFIEITKS